MGQTPQERRRDPGGEVPVQQGKPEVALPWSTMPFYYMPQVQGQMEIMDRDWADLYCWTPNESTIFLISRELGYRDLIHGMLPELRWENVVPTKEAVCPWIGTTMPSFISRHPSTRVSGSRYSKERSLPAR
ncbi:hypothetical protein MLD38_031705 [Melastoma candidum]|uniref:Uncharacterized protein n=1 Tax=Melastoma candidum TaxID=119954 RepID=A0ACB9MQH5_9MYRT|nr:hypothetical protein MLD38_031705 [Melastoma candidum]